MKARDGVARICYTLLKMRIRASYDPGFVAALKVGTRSRKWEPNDKEWVVDLREHKEALRIVKQYYDSITEENKPPGEERKKRRKGGQQSAPKSFVGIPQTSDYGVLYLLPTAPIELVRSTYRTLSKFYHPDTSKMPNAGEKMKALNRAYESLMKRRQS